MELLIASEQETAASLAKRIALAKELGHKNILLLFTHSKRHQALMKRIRDCSGEGVLFAALVTTQNQAKALKKEYDAIVAPCARTFFESKHVDYILEPERQSRSDFIHHRNSGLNQVLLKLCRPTSKRPGKGILTSTSLLLNTPRPETMLGRMQQNARWCRKYKVHYEVTSGARSRWEQRDAESVKALARLLLTSHKA